MSDTSPTQPAGGITHLPKFFVKQRLTLMVNRYEIRTANPDGTPGAVVAIAQQKRLAFKEQVTFYSDEARTTPVFSFKARNILELAAVYDVYDAAGTPIGFFQKDFTASLLRSSFHFDFTDKATGQVVLSSEKKFALRDQYVVTVPDARLDFRLAAAMAVGLDALMAR